MSGASTYSAVETLRNGREVVIRAFQPSDRDGFISAASRLSKLSLYRRFFTAKSSFTERERQFFLNVDFIKHVALVALVDESGHRAIVGGGRYVVVQPGRAEVAFVVIDRYQGLGIGAALMRHLVTIANDARLQELVAEVLPENQPMLRVFAQCGLPMDTVADSGVAHVTLRLN
jgi:RimJ/RimL family protein N-acetyltransferase